jgi:glycosyltransferase involved in cell wall biosynthesis
VRVSLVLTVLNEADSITQVLEGIAAQTRLPDEIIVVDGGSTDGTVDQLRAYSARLPIQVIVEPGANISRGRNLAIAQASGEVIAVTDAGVRLAPDWLERLVARFDASPAPDLVSGFFLPDPQGLFEQALAVTTLPALAEMGRGRFLPSSRSVAFTRAAWQAIGGYPEWMTYSEDVLFDLALMRAGARIAYAPDALVWFRPRRSLTAFARQYRNYAYGDGQGLLWPRRQAIRYFTYLIALPALSLLLKRQRVAGGLLAAVAGGAMFFTPFKRLHASPFPLHHKLGAALLIPVIRLVGDLAKMWGFPQGVPEGVGNHRRTQAYLNQSLSTRSHFHVEAQ